MDHGYEKSTTNRIAERAGYSVGTLYQYFVDKEDIFNELIENELGELLLTMSEFKPHASLRETLWTINQNVYDIFRDDPNFFQAMDTLLSGRYRQQRDDATEKLIDIVAKLLSAHRDEIFIDDIDTAARVFVGITGGVGMTSTAEYFTTGAFLSHALRVQLSYLTTDITSVRLI